jgi:hypothetical protein
MRYFYRIPSRLPSSRSNLEKHGKAQGMTLFKRLRAVANRPSLRGKRTARDEKGARALKSELSRLLHLWRCSSSQPAKEPQGLVKWLERQGKSRKVYDSTRQPIACVVVSKSF